MPKKKQLEVSEDELVDKVIEWLKIAISQQQIKYRLHRDYGMPMNRWLALKEKVTAKLKENFDILEANRREIQNERLEGLLNDAIEQQDGALALKVLQEINKVSGLYETKVKIDSTDYHLDI